MDITSFSSNNFNTKTWINEILKNAEEDNINYTMSLVAKLQLYVQRVNNSLEETSHQLLLSLPKIMRDTKNLQEEALTLKHKMSTVHNEILQIEHDTGSTIKKIEQLDNLKTQFQTAKQALHESDNWIVLVADLEEVFYSKNIETISSKLLAMQNSLKLLINVSDYENRKQQLEGLKNRLEAIASPAIVQAFSTNNTEKSASYSHIFKSIDRLPQLIKYYHKCQRDILIKKWHLQLEQDESVLQCVHNFYHDLLSHWHTQYRWFNQVFNVQNDVSNDVLLDIYIDALASLEPSINDCLDATLKQTTDKMTLLIEFKQITKQFAENLSRVEAPCIKEKSEKFLTLIKAIFRPMAVYVKRYSTYEQTLLTQELSSVHCMKDELSETVQALGLSVPTILNIVEKSKKRCQEMTENCGLCSLILAYRSFFASYSDMFRVAMRQIERFGKYEEDEDWTRFQLCLSLLQYVGEIMLGLQQIENDLVAIIMNLKRSSNKFIVDYKYLLLIDDELKEFESLLRCISDENEFTLLDNIMKEFVKLGGDIYYVTNQVVLAPISKQFENVERAEIWEQVAKSNAPDLPDYSLSPQEYITQIGQYLMTLPQHLEPFLFNENPALTFSLKAIDSQYNESQEIEGALADIFLKFVAQQTCVLFCDKILSINELNLVASKQLAHDISYLENILKDLGICLTENLQQVAILLKIPPDQYQSQSSGYSVRLVAAIRQIRHITIS